MRILWFVLVGASVVIITACFRFPKEEPVSTIFPKGYARPVALNKGNWQSGYNFALGEALQQADRRDFEESIVIPYAPGKAPKTSAKIAIAPAKKRSEPSMVAKAMDKGEKKLRRLVAKLTKRGNIPRANPAKNVMLSATSR